MSARLRGRHGGGANALQPRVGGVVVGLEGVDGIALLEGEADIVEAVEEAVLAELVHLEGDGLAVGADNGLRGEIDLDLALVGVLHQHAHLVLGQDDGQHAVLEAVVEEDVGERGRDNGANAEVVDRPGGVLAGGPAPEVVARHKDLGLTLALLVENEVRVLSLPVALEAHLIEGGDAEAGALDGLEELLGDDHVRVHVLHVQLSGHALEVGELGHAAARRAAAGLAGGLFGQLGRGHVEVVPAIGGLELLAELGDGAEAADIGEGALDGGGGGHGGGHEVRAPAVALATLEVAIGGGRAALARGELVGVHGEAHGAPGLAPLEAGLDEDVVKPLRLRLLLDVAGARHHEGCHARGHLVAPGDGGHLTQVLDAAVGARADEHHLHGNLIDLLARGQAHVVQGALHGGGALGVGCVLGVGHDAGHGHDVLRGGAPGNRRGDVRGIDGDHLVVLGPGVGGEGPPRLHRLVPECALGGHGAALEVVEGDVIGLDHAGAGAALDRHVADGHAGLHGEGLDGGATELDDAAGAAGGANEADDVEDDVLGGHAGEEGAVDLNLHVHGLLLEESLGGEHVLHLGGADAKGKGAKGAVGGGVGVAAHAGGSGEGEALLGADDMHDALVLRAQAIVGHAELSNVVLERNDLGAGLDLGDELLDGGELRAVGGGHVVVHGGEGVAGLTHRAARVAEPLEGLGGGHLVDEVAVDVDEAGAVLLARDDVLVPDLVEHGAGGVAASRGLGGGNRGGTGHLGSASKRGGEHGAGDPCRGLAGSRRAHGHDGGRPDVGASHAGGHHAGGGAAPGGRDPHGRDILGRGGDGVGRHGGWRRNGSRE
mmetsp:Transcript_54566/g.173374  ORF Transcript_54566/g.173374 Transcript_54566/m.173374 type:complete len:829 (-) Transcript_54566:162-2648(-)